MSATNTLRQLCRLVRRPLRAVSRSVSTDFHSSPTLFHHNSHKSSLTPVKLGNNTTLSPLYRNITYPFTLRHIYFRTHKTISLHPNRRPCAQSYQCAPYATHVVLQHKTHVRGRVYVPHAILAHAALASRRASLAIIDFRLGPRPFCR